MQVTAPAENKRVHPLVCAFVASNVLMVTIYALPKPTQAVVNNEVPAHGTDIFLKWNDATLKTHPFLETYILPTGLWQYWDMFAPNPAQTDFWCDAQIIFFDGSHTTYQYPRMKELPLTQKYLMERYRKFYERVNQSDPAHGNDNGWMWPVFAQHFALINAKDPKNPPVKVGLTRHWQEVARHDAKRGPEPPYQSYTYYWHIVDQTKLARDMGWNVGKR
ncbi:MAG: hypothetical protein WCK51_06400 [Armatimonadota bacterium]